MSQEPERYELLDDPRWNFAPRPREPLDPSRREFLQLLGAGVVILALPAAPADAAPAQERGRREAATLGARLHLGADGTITVLCGKVEAGQGARTQLTMAAAEELCVGLASIRLILADSSVVPDDGGTYGSRTTPATVPAIRAACAAARELLVATAARLWNAQPAAWKVEEGAVTSGEPGQRLTYADLVQHESVDVDGQAIGRDVAVRRVSEWSVLGRATPRVGARDIVTGAHRHPSDIVRPGMLRGVVLRPPSFGATLESIDLAAAGRPEEVVAVRDCEFVGFAAATSFAARRARDAAESTARWKLAPHPSSEGLFDRLVASAGQAGVAGGRDGPRRRGASDAEIESARTRAAHVLSARYHVAYVQHAPLEPRAAVAEWSEAGLCVWTGTQNPGRVREELARAFGLAAERVRVIVPDTGGAFGGKHTGEVAVEAARLAKEARRPVALQWTREEEFTWAYFRPAGVVELGAGLGADGRIDGWTQRNFNSGSSSIETPYAVAASASEFLASDAPLRQGSYRALAATANTFARESFMDELAAAAGVDPLDLRLSHLADERLRAVLLQATGKFEWRRRRAEAHGDPARGVGLACGTEKGSYVAACVELAIDAGTGRYSVSEVCEAFECGAIHEPANLRSQVEGAIVQGLGAALKEEIRFRDGRIENPRFSRYDVPRFRDVPRIVPVLVDRPDLPSAGAGETPIIAVAPAIANALHAATGTRIRSLPIRDERYSAA